MKTVLKLSANKHTSKIQTPILKDLLREVASLVHLTKQSLLLPQRLVYLQSPLVAAENRTHAYSRRLVIRIVPSLVPTDLHVLGSTENIFILFRVGLINILM